MWSKVHRHLQVDTWKGFLPITEIYRCIWAQTNTYIEYLSRTETLSCQSCLHSTTVSHRRRVMLPQMFSFIHRLEVQVKPVRQLTKVNHILYNNTCTVYVALKDDRKHNEKHGLLAKLKRIAKGFGNSSAVGILIRKASATFLMLIPKAIQGERSALKLT